MRKFLTMFFIVFCTAAASYGQATPGNTAEADVRRLERRWLDAYEQHDVKAMTEIVADDFLITFPNGNQQTKAQILSMISRPRDAANPSKFYTESVKARVYGETVILTGKVISEYVQAGKPVKEVSSYTDTYVRSKGRWQVVASHLSEVAKPQTR